MLRQTWTHFRPITVAVAFVVGITTTVSLYSQSNDEQVTPAGRGLQGVAQSEAFSGVVTEVRPNGELVITEMREKSTPAQTGLNKGDRIVEFDSHPLRSRNETEKLLRQTETQQYHVVKVVRDGQEVEVVLGQHVDFLGMLIVPDASSRSLVRRVEDKTPAAEAGMHVDDIVVGASGRKIESFDQFNEFVIPLVRKMSAGQEINLRVIRDTEEMDVTIIRPEELKLPLISAPRRSTRIEESREMKMKEVQTPPKQSVAVDSDVQAVVAVLYSKPSQAGTAGTQPVAVPLVPNVPDTAAPVTTPAVVPTAPTVGGSTVRQSVTTQTTNATADVAAGTLPALPAISPSISNRIGIAAVSSTANGGMLQARVLGLPQGKYRLVLHQFGDCRDVTTAGPIVGVLATFQVNSNGEVELQHPLEQQIATSKLLGRVVSVIPFDVTLTNAQTVTTSPFAYGVFGSAAPGSRRSVV